MIITIDGLAGAGKSSIAERLAKRVGALHLNTGGMYRAFTAYISQRHPELLDPFDPEAIVAVALGVHCQVTLIEGGMHFTIDGESFDHDLMDPRISLWVSPIASLPQLRLIMQKWQKLLPSLMTTQGIDVLVAEGRDMGSVVFPGAEHKFFLTASDRARAHRRFKQLFVEDKLKGRNEEEILSELLERDRIDSEREHSPLVIPEGAFVVDTSDITPEEVLEVLLGHIRRD